jgi:hypothetical protein
MSSKHRALVKVLSFALVCWIAHPAGALAQGTLDQFLAGVSVSSSGKCSQIDIRFNQAASYSGHAPAKGGTNLVVRLTPLGTEQTPDKRKIPLKESANVPAGNPADLKSVSFDATTAGGPVIRLAFGHNVNFSIAMGNDSRVLRIDTADEANAARCFNVAGAAPKTSAKPNVAAKVDAPAKSTDLVGDGKKALTAKDYGRAVALFTKAVSEGDAAAKQEAQEYLGLARERAGQLAHAKAEYKTYLKLYPDGEGAARVKQRLDGVLAAQQDAAEEQFAKRNLTKAEKIASQKTPAPTEKKPGSNAVAGADKVIDQPVSNQRTKRNLGGEPADPDAWTWQKNASVSQYYYRDDSFSSSDILKGSLGTHETVQNDLISSGDFFLQAENQTYELALRGAAFNEKGFGNQSDIFESNVSTIYMDAKHKPSGLFSRLGRQSRSTGGVFGRFDGANVGMEVDKNLKLQAVLGSPVYSRDALPFADDRLFYGASIDYTFPNQEWAAALYAIEQNVGDVIDRRAVGGELRYAGKDIFAYSGIDYDVYYGEINNAYLSGTWNYMQGGSVYATVDYRHVPFLLTSNALMGQLTNDLPTFVDLWGRDTAIALAMDRTASAKSLTVGATYPLTDQWQIALDATIADYTGTPESDILATEFIDAIPNPGIEFYGSAQLTGTSVFKENDSLGYGLRYSENDSSRLYLADTSYRYPFNDKLRINTRFRTSYRDSKTQDAQQMLFMPTVGFRYRFDNNWNFELEGGARWEHSMAAAGDDENLDLLMSAGYRYEF